MHVYTHQAGAALRLRLIIAMVQCVGAVKRTQDAADKRCVTLVERMYACTCECAQMTDALIGSAINHAHFMRLYDNVIMLHLRNHMSLNTRWNGVLACQTQGSRASHGRAAAGSCRSIDGGIGLGSGQSCPVG